MQGLQTSFWAGQVADDEHAEATTAARNGGRFPETHQWKGRSIMNLVSDQ